jgi:hypothetical protein
MKITEAWLNSQEFAWTYLADQEAFDALPESPVGLARQEELDAVNRRLGISAGRTYPTEVYFSAPSKFPCILLEGHTFNNSNGPNWISTMYLYDVEIVDTDLQAVDQSEVGS